jgi:hypothetical protein
MRPRSILVGSAILGLLTATSPATTSSASNEPRAVPRPRFDGLASATRTEMLRYANSLVFDSSALGSDTRRLMVRTKTGLVAGPSATLSPEIGTTTMTLAEMDEGRILARIVVDEAIPVQGYGKGANYIWVDRIDGTLRAVIIPADPSVPTRQFGFRVKHDRINAPGTKPEARFRWDEFAKSETIWARCDLGCCEVQSDGGMRPRPDLIDR